MGVGRVEAQKRAQSSRGCPDEEIARALGRRLLQAQSEVRRDHLCARALSSLPDLPPSTAHRHAIRGLHAAWQAGNDLLLPEPRTLPKLRILQELTIQLSQLMHQLKSNNALEREPVGEVQMMCCEPLLGTCDFFLGTSSVLLHVIWYPRWPSL